VVVENRPGGDGFVAINAFVSARDDHILLFGPAASFTAHPFLHEKLPYDPRDLSPVARVGQDVVPGSAAEFAASIDQQRAVVAESARILGIKAATQ
jgi:hypothetical protein